MAKQNVSLQQVRLLETLEPKGLSKIPKGTVGIVQAHCDNRELKVKFKLCNASVEVKVKEKQVGEKFSQFCVLTVAVSAALSPQ